MSTGSNNSPRYVNCPKCDGAKYIRGFSHYAGGVCFMCSGNGTVEANGVSTPASGTPVAHKVVSMGDFGTATIVRFGAGFQADISRFSEESDRVEPTGMVTFDVVNGRIANAIVSDGPRRRGEGPALVAALQAALKR